MLVVQANLISMFPDCQMLHHLSLILAKLTRFGRNRSFLQVLWRHLILSEWLRSIVLPQESPEGLGCPNGTSSLPRSSAPVVPCSLGCPPQQRGRLRLFWCGGRVNRGQRTQGCRKPDSLILLPVEQCACNDDLSYKILRVLEVTLPFTAFHLQIMCI